MDNNIIYLKDQPKEEKNGFLKALIEFAKKFPSKNYYSPGEKATRREMMEQLAQKYNFDASWWNNPKYIKNGKAMLKSEVNQRLYIEVDEEESGEKGNVDVVGEAVGEAIDGEEDEAVYVFVNEDDYLNKLIEEDELDSITVGDAASQLFYDSDTLPSPQEIVIYRSSSYESDAPPPSPVMYGAFRNLFVGEEASTTQMTGIPGVENLGAPSTYETGNEDVEYHQNLSTPQPDLDNGETFHQQHSSPQPNFASVALELCKDLNEKHLAFAGKQLDLIQKLAEMNKKK